MPIQTGSLEIELTAADAQFITKIDNRLTKYKTTPYSIPEPLIIDVIQQAARLFFREYAPAAHKTFLYIDHANINDFVQTNYTTLTDAVGFWLTLPSSVRNVINAYRANDTARITSQELIDNVQLLQRSAPYGQSILGINNSLYIVEAAVRTIESNVFSSIFANNVPYSYSVDSKKLHIFEPPTKSLILECLCNIDLQKLYYNDLFIDYVIAKCKDEMRGIIGGHTTPLSGEVTLNVDEICGAYGEAAKEIEAKLRSGVGDIILMR